jgi:glycosyltransferase involved in cell wall biosynthesis
MVMHVVLVSPFPRDPDHIGGGVAGVAKYLVDELSRWPGIRTTVIDTKTAVEKTVCEKWNSYDVYRLSRCGTWRFLPMTFYELFAGQGQLGSLLRQVNPDVVHFQGVTLLAAGCRWPSVLTIHGIAERDALWDWQRGVLRWGKWLLLKLTESYGRHRVHNVILISDYVRKFLPPGGMPRRVWSVPNPVADSFFGVDWTPEPGRLFCCCRVMPRKNTLGMINAFAEIIRQFPQAQLRVGGTAEADYLRLCERQVEISNLQGKVRFLAHLSIAAVQAELSKANCLVMPSFQETAPLAVEEAMAVGVPVVGAKVGGIPEMIEDGKTGFLVNPHDTNSISDAVLKILLDCALARSMSNNAKKVAREKYAASVVCEKTLEIYHAIVETFNKRTEGERCPSAPLPSDGDALGRT